jgi:hypothetical protein
MSRSFSLIAAVLLVHGCAYHRLAVKNPNPADQTYHPVNSSALAWGAAEELSIAKKCEHDMAEVRVRTSLGEALLTVVTLGFYQPARIEYRCAKKPTQEGEIEP